MQESYKEAQSLLELLEQLDEEDKKHILINYDEEETEVAFRWEYAHESCSEIDSVFRHVYPDK